MFWFQCHFIIEYIWWRLELHRLLERNLIGMQYIELLSFAGEIWPLLKAFFLNQLGYNGIWYMAQLHPNLGKNSFFSTFREYHPRCRSARTTVSPCWRGVFSKIHTKLGKFRLNFDPQRNGSKMGASVGWCLASVYQIHPWKLTCPLKKDYLTIWLFPSVVVPLNHQF